MTQHDHPAYVEGCYRCEFGRDEVDSIRSEEFREAAARQAKRWSETLRLLGRGPGDES